MNVTKQISKDAVREWLKQEVAQHRPPPSIEQIQRELGRTMIDMARKERERLGK